MSDVKLTPIVQAVIGRSINQRRIIPSWVANESYLELDPEEISPLKVRHGCTEHLKQIARQVLSKKFAPTTPEDIEAYQPDLWAVQRHYPSVDRNSDGEPIYVLRDDLTEADILFNVHRMETTADSLKAHARRLMQFGIDRGVLKAAA